jgi:hypothetical protein
MTDEDVQKELDEAEQIMEGVATSTNPFSILTGAVRIIPNLFALIRWCIQEIKILRERGTKPTPYNIEAGQQGIKRFRVWFNPHDYMGAVIVTKEGQDGMVFNAYTANDALEQANIGIHYAMKGHPAQPFQIAITKIEPEESKPYTFANAVTRVEPKKAQTRAERLEDLADEVAKIGTEVKELNDKTRISYGLGNNLHTVAKDMRLFAQQVKLAEERANDE